MSEYVIGSMTREQVPAVAHLETLCFPDPWSENSVASELENPLSLWLTATDGQTLLGYVGSQSVLGEADMMNLAVNPSARRRGIGRALVLELVERLKRNGVHSLTLEVRASNAAAQGLYASLGFSQVGRRPGYYLEPKEDACILRKEWEL